MPLRSQDRARTWHHSTLWSDLQAVREGAQGRQGFYRQIPRQRVHSSLSVSRWRSDRLCKEEGRFALPLRRLSGYQQAHTQESVSPPSNRQTPRSPLSSEDVFEDRPQIRLQSRSHRQRRRMEDHVSKSLWLL